MASQSETGHPINVANLKKLISRCTGYGAKYNPTLGAIKLAALNTLYTNADSAIDAVNDKFYKLVPPTNQRQELFEPIEKLTTRIVNALIASGTTQKLVDDAQTIAKKISGTRAAGIPPLQPAAQTEEAEAKQKKQISTAQQSFDSILANFKKLKELLEEETLYAPNETDLKITALTTLITALTAKNDAVVNATTALESARISRNHLLYDDNTGLVDIAQKVKKYVISVFGATAPEYKQISGIEFTRH